MIPVLVLACQTIAGSADCVNALYNAMNRLLRMPEMMTNGETCATWHQQKLGECRMSLERLVLKGLSCAELPNLAT